MCVDYASVKTIFLQFAHPLWGEVGFEKGSLISLKIKEVKSTMAKGQQPDYRVATVVNDSESGKDRWTNIGVAFKNADTITVLVDALPVNGKLILQKPKEDKE